MRIFFFLLGLICFWGCSAVHNTTDNVAPKLLMQEPLPPASKSIQANLKLNMDLLINTDGSVGVVRLLNSSGDKEWDSLAIESIRKWKFTPAIVNGKPVAIWLRQSAIVAYMDPKFLSLAEIVCPTFEEADSVYNALLAGNDFSELVAKHSISESKNNNGNIGSVDIRYYPENIRQELISLTDEDFTKPLEFGNQFIILKKVK